MALYLVLAAPGPRTLTHGLLTDPEADFLPLAFLAFLALRVTAGPRWRIRLPGPAADRHRRAT